MTIPAAFLDELRARIGITEVVGKRVRLARRGRDYLGLCPFHQEKTPSFTVFDDHYHCFGCGAHGSVFDFVMQTEGLGFREAVERLAGDAGMQMPAERPESVEDAGRRALHDVVEAAASYFQRMLQMPEGKEALAYLHRRGVGDDLIAKFRLGYAPSGRSALRSHLSREGVDEDQMLRAGLLIRPEDEGRAPYDRFRGRIMFPIGDRRGRVVGFGGRVLGSGEPKYLNSPETPLFTKGRLLYGLPYAARAARETGTIIVAEGYMDVISLVGAGYENAVAPLGTALTVDQITELWRVAPEPIVLFDPDVAGHRAAARAAERVLPMLRPGYGLKFAFVTTETGDDPDGVVRRYPQQFLSSALSSAASVSDVVFWTETGGRPIRTPEERAALEGRLRAKLATIADETVRTHFLKGTRERIWQEYASRSGSARTGRSGKGRAQGSPGAVLAPVTSMQHQSEDPMRQREAILLAVVINNPATVDDVGERLGSLTFLDADLDRLRQTVLELMASEPGVDSAGLQSHLRTCGYSSVLDALLSTRTLCHAFFARHGTAVQTAVEGWEETYARYTRDRIRREIEREKRRVAASLKQECERESGESSVLRTDDPRYGYLEALKRQEYDAADKCDGTGAVAEADVAGRGPTRRQ